MKIPGWLLLVGFNFSAIGGLIFVFWATNSIIDSIFEIKKRAKFSDELGLALQNGKPTWSEVLDFAELGGVSRNQVSYTLRQLNRDIITGKNTTLAPYKADVEHFLASLRAAEPFEGMPSEIRIHLERLQEKGADVRSLIEPLTSQIRDLLALKSKENRHQKYYTVGGFVIGVVGLLFAGYTYVYPPVAAEGGTSTQVRSLNK